MKKEYNISGLDCAHCAVALENGIKKVDGVKSCIVNFTTSKILVEVDDDNSKEILKNVLKISKQINPSVKISEDAAQQKSIKIYDIVLYVVGLILGIIVVFVKMNPIAFYILLVISALFMGYKTYWLALRQLRYFKINENTLITLSLIGACAIGESMEGLMVVALYTLGKMLESKAVNYSRKSISALISTQPEYAVLYKDGKEEKVKPELVEIGDIIIVKVGEKIPVDGKVIEGSASVDKKHLTGESVPVSVAIGDKIESGSIVLDSALIIEVTSLYKDSAISKILDLVSNASNRKSKTETFISKFSSFYTMGVIAFSIIVWGLSWAILGDINTAIYRGLIFLVVSCPCAFAISIPLSYFSGIGRCSKQGILIKGSNFLDSCSKIDSIIFDKTGTLTTGNFSVSKVEVNSGYEKDNMLDIVVAGEKRSLHPIAKAIVQYYDKDNDLKIEDFKEVAGKGIQFKIEKDSYFIGRVQDSSGFTVVNVKKNDEDMGRIFLQDTIKENAVEMIKNINELKIKTMMLTGDNESVAQNVAKTINIDEYKAELLPEDKFKILQEEKAKNHTVAFVGDGINDAPALTLSDVGISMGLTGSQATIESSDVVIADDNIYKVCDLFEISKYTKKIVWENLIFALSTKILFLVLGSVGLIGMLLAVFADVGVTLLAILNSLRVLTFKHKDKKKSK